LSSGGTLDFGASRTPRGSLLVIRRRNSSHCPRNEVISARARDNSLDRTKSLGIVYQRIIVQRLIRSETPRVLLHQV